MFTSGSWTLPSISIETAMPEAPRFAADFTETVNATIQGGGPKVTTTAYLYSGSFAVALCEGPISGIGRIWADGKPLDLSGITIGNVVTTTSFTALLALG